MQQHILMILDEEFPPDDRVYKEAQTLISAGFSVSIACYTFQDRPVLEVIDNIQIFRKKIPALIYKSSVAALRIPTYFNWWKQFITSLLKENTFHIIHIHDLPLAKVGVYFKQKHKLKLVVDLHENWPSALEKATHINNWMGKILSPIALWRKYERTILKQADLVVTVVDEMKERLKQLGVDSKITVLENTLSLENFPTPSPKNKKDNDSFTLFFAGGLNVERGLQYVIPGIAMAKQKIPNIKLCLVGNGSYKSELERLAKEYSVENEVEFLGWKPLDEVLKLTANADVALIPHLKWEQTDCSSPNKLFQCMFEGVPLLVSNCNSLERIVRETQSGRSYPFDDYNIWVEQLEYLYSNPKEREKMGQNGTQAVINKYNWANSSKHFVEDYKQLSEI